MRGRPITLTPQRRAVLQAVADSPLPLAYREIGRAVGLSSTSSVWAHVRRLVADGLLAQHPGHPRSTAITTAGLRALGIASPPDLRALLQEAVEFATWTPTGAEEYHDRKIAHGDWLDRARRALEVQP